MISSNVIDCLTLFGPLLPNQISKGMITGLFDRFTGATHCLAGITLGNLYWFFYGTV